MKKFTYLLGVFGLLLLLGMIAVKFFKGITPSEISAKEKSEINFETLKDGEMIRLPDYHKKSNVSLEEALMLRRSVRSYDSEPVLLWELSQLLWSAQGITNDRGFRTTPSAGATFPLEMYVMVNNVEGLVKGIYHYHPAEHSLSFISSLDVSRDLMRASLSQSMITDAGLVLIFGAVMERTIERYFERAERYVYNEVGHASQNVHLQAAALNLGTVVIGAYSDEEVEAVLNLGPDVRVLYMMPVGKLNP